LLTFGIAPINHWQFLLFFFDYLQVEARKQLGSDAHGGGMSRNFQSSLVLWNSARSLLLQGSNRLRCDGQKTSTRRFMSGFWVGFDLDKEITMYKTI